MKAPWGSPPHPHFYEFHSTSRRNYESDGKPKSEWPGEGVGGRKENPLKWEINK